MFVSDSFDSEDDVALVCRDPIQAVLPESDLSGDKSELELKCDSEHLGESKGSADSRYRLLATGSHSAILDSVQLVL